MAEYVGVPPQRRGLGFGRRTTGEPARPESFTLSTAAQDFIAQDRMRRQAERDAELAALETSAIRQADEAAARAAFGNQRALVNDIDYEIGGIDSQYLEIELDPGEAVIADNGSMIWKDADVDFDTIMGDGAEDGFFNALVSAGSNLIGGESMFMGEFRHIGHTGKARLALGGRCPGHILPIRLEAMGGQLVCQRGAFLAAAKGVSVAAKFVSNPLVGLAGGEGFALQLLTGAGWAFLHVGGGLIERQLAEGQVLHVDAGCVAAFEKDVKFDIVHTGGSRGVMGAAARSVKNAVIGGEGLLFARLTGPGKVWIQTLPFERMSRTVVQSAEIQQRGQLLDSEGDGIGIGDIADGISTAMRFLK